LSPILVRPVREQLEHDRVIRLLQAKYKRKFEVAINPGNEQTAPVGPGPSPWYPDLVLLSSERTRKLVGVVEVETSESINHLEAMSQWAAFSKLRVPFHLYVPTSGIDSARRLCTDLQIPTTEIWAYQAIGDQIRFTPVQRAPGASDGKDGKENKDGKGRATSEPREPAVAKPAAAKAAAAPRAPAARPKPARAVVKPTARAAARPKPRPAATRPKGAAAKRDLKASARKVASPASKAQKRR
jgi:hypothetical protein